MFVFPPYSTFDENIHIPKSFYYSNVILGREHNRDGHTLTWQHRQEDSRDGFWVLAPEAPHYHHIASNFFSLASSPETFEAVTERVGPLYQYLPQVIGVTIARLLNFGQVPTLYLGRLFSLMGFIFIMYFAIKIAPFKTLFLLLGLAPNILLIAGSFSYDTMKNALFFLFVAYIFYLAFSQQRLRRRDYVFMIILGALIAPLKYIYVPVLLLPLIIPKESYYKLRGAKVIFCALLFFVGMISTFVFQGVTMLGVAQQSFELDAGLTPWADDYGYTLRGYTLRYFFDNPQVLLRLLSVSMLRNLFNIITSISSVAYSPLPIWIGFVVFCFFVISIMPEGQGKQFVITLKQKIIILFCAVAIYFLGHAAALPWTTVGAYSIMGVQHRYFIPLLPLLVIPLHTIFRREKNYDSAMIFAVALINAYGILYIFTRAIFI